MTPPLRRREIFGLSALAVVAMLTWLWSRQGVDDGARVVPARLDAPGYYLRDAVIVGTGEDGSALYRIHAASAEELPEEQRLLLSDVTVEYQSEVNVPWVLTAAGGEAFLDRTYLDFNGDVELTRSGEDDFRPMVIRTVALRLEPESFEVHTESPVSLFIGGERLDAVGLSANLKAERLALESSVHGVFGSE